MAKITINTTQYNYELHGQGHPLVLIAGYTCDHAFWLPVLDKLTKQFQVLLFDNRGVGQTKDHQEPLSADLMADDVIGLCQALDVKQPHIVGHSMGGTIAQSIGARYWQKIGKLAILCSTPKWRQPTLLGLQTQLMMRKQNVNSDLIIDSVLSWIFGESFLQDQGKVENIKKLINETPFPQSLNDQERQLQVLIKFNGATNLTKIKVPTLVAYGTQDIVALPDEAKFLGELIPEAKLVELNCAHGMIEEIPDESADMLIRFFR